MVEVEVPTTTPGDDLFSCPNQPRPDRYLDSRPGVKQKEALADELVP